MHPHIFFSDYKLSLYIDGNTRVLNDIEKEIQRHKNFPISMFNHHARNCIYDEAKACISQKKEDPERIRNYINKLKKERYPASHGLNEANVILRRHNEERIIKTMEEWWNEFIQYSRRDQLSLNYVLWKNNIVVNSLGVSYKKSEYFMKYPHGISKHEEQKLFIKRFIRNLICKSKILGIYQPFLYLKRGSQE